MATVVALRLLMNDCTTKSQGSKTVDRCYDCHLALRGVKPNSPEFLAAHQTANAWGAGATDPAAHEKHAGETALQGSSNEYLQHSWTQSDKRFLGLTLNL